MFTSLAKKVAVITGASSGIGAATAIEFAKLSSSLTLVGRNEERLRVVSKECKEIGLSDSEIHVVIGDITSDAVRRNIIESTVKHFGRLDILVNNAGSAVSEKFGDISSSNLDDMFDLHVKSPLMLSQLAAPYLIKTKGSIINVSSTSATEPCDGLMAYEIAKAGSDQMTRATAIALGQHGIRVNSVNPSITRTPIFQTSKMTQNHEDDEQLYAYWAKLHPLQRIAEPEEIARTIVFLASDGASFMTAQNIYVDGGICTATQDPMNTFVK